MAGTGAIRELRMRSDLPPQPPSLEGRGRSPRREALVWQTADSKPLEAEAAFGVLRTIVSSSIDFEELERCSELFSGQRRNTDRGGQLAVIAIAGPAASGGT